MPDFWARTTRIGFTASAYPILFFADFFKQIHELVASHFTQSIHLDIQSRPIGECMALLETSFLGMRSLYVLKNVSELSAASKQQWLSYLANYQGPHCVIFFIQADDAQVDDCIVLPAAIDKQLFAQLLTFFAGQACAQRSHAAVQAIYARQSSLPLDTACSMMRYLMLMGNGHQTFFENWIDTFIEPETSLFTLSQHFFARAPQKFFATWKGISSHYGEQFWIAFWSEQLWRAYHVVDYLQQSRFVEAKGVSYRLPFSLMQQDWKKLTLTELQQAHAFLYGIDTALKNGGNTVSLDLFYSKFFLKQFGAEQK